MRVPESDSSDCRVTPAAGASRSSSSPLDTLVGAPIPLPKSDAKHATNESRDPFRELPFCQLNDEAIMSLVQSGDRQALGALFDRYSRLVQNVATRILRDATEAQDLVQDVFLYVHRRSRVFDPTKGSIASWLIQITYSRAFTRRELLNARAKTDCSRIEELAAWADVDGGLQKLTDALVARELVHQALAELTERQRQTLRMYFFEGYSLREISTNLNESFTNTRHHYYRGIEKLKEVLKSSLARRTEEGVA